MHVLRNFSFLGPARTCSVGTCYIATVYKLSVIGTTISDIFSCNSTMRRWILIILAGIFRRKRAIERCYNFAPHLTSVSKLPCKTGNTEITLFHWNVVSCFANRHTEYTHHNYQLVRDRLSISHKTIKCMQQTWINTRHKASSIWYAHSRRSPCLPWYQTPCQL